MAGNTQKITIVEVADNTTWYSYHPYYANVWLVQTNNDYTGLASSEFNLESIGLDNTTMVLSFSVFKRNYLKVETVAEVISEQSSFYYNHDTKTLLVHFENHKPYYYFDDSIIDIGFSLGFFNTNASTDGEWNGEQYAPRLTNSSVFKDTLDDLFYSKQKYQSGNVTIDNHDLKYKNFNIGAGVKKKNGNLVRISQWTGEDSTTATYDEFDITYQGVIEKVSEGTSISLGLRDIRASLTVKSPMRYLSGSDFLYIADMDKDYLIPELWGKCYSVPTLCLNENVNDDGNPTGDYDFMICDVTNHPLDVDSVQAVYINGKLIDITPDIFETFTTASINIPKSYFAVVEDDVDTIRYENMDKVTIDCHGYLDDSDSLIENGLEVIRTILDDNYGYQYTDTYYDTTTWQSFEDDAYSVGYYLGEQKETQQQIEELASSQLGKFIWDANLKFSFNNYDFVEFDNEIGKHKFYPSDFVPIFDQDSTQVISIVRVGHKKRWSDNQDESGYDWLVDESNKDNAFTEYASTKTKDFSTLINNSTDAQDYATRSIVYVGISKDTFTILTDWSYKDLRAGDWVKVQADHSTEDLIGWTKCQVQEVSPQTDKYMVQLKLRIFGYYRNVVSNDVLVLRNGLEVIKEY